FVFGELLACDGSARRIADQSGEISNQKDADMAEILKMFHLPDQHRVADMNIRRGRIKACLDAQRRPGALRALQFFEQLFFTNDVDRAAADMLELFLNRDCFEISHRLFIIAAPRAGLESRNGRTERNRSLQNKSGALLSVSSPTAFRRYRHPRLEPVLAK